MNKDFYNPRQKIAKSVLIIIIPIICGLLIWHIWRNQKERLLPQPILISLAIPAGNPKRTAVIREVIDEFLKSHPDVQVAIQDIPGSRYYQKVLVMLASRTGPDIMWIGQSFSEFADKGVFLNLNPYIAKSADLNLGEYNQQVLSWYQYDKNQYAIPFGIDMRIMVYNKDLFDKADIKYPNDDWNFDDFLKICKKLTIDKNGDGRIEQYGYQGILEACLFNAEAISPDGSRAACNTHEMIDYLQTNLDMFQKYRVSPSPKEQMQQTGLDRFSVFRQNKIGIMMMATWDLPEMKKQFANMRWDIVLNPKIYRHGQWVSSQAFAIWSETKYPDVCWELYRKLSGPELQKRIAFQAIPTHQAILSKAVTEYRGQPGNIAALQKAMDRLNPTPRVSNLQELMTIWGNACQSVWSGRMTPSEAMKTAEHQINQTIRKRKK